MPIALTRAVSPSMADCQLTHLVRTPLDVGRAAAQHGMYEAALAACGYEVVRVPPAPACPDAVFVEDVLVAVDEIAIATRPGAASRRAEVSGVAEAAARWRPVVAIEAPGTLDGGDVLRLGRRLLVGRSGRTNDDGIRQLAALLAPFGYTVDAVEVGGCLHLKSAITEAGERTVLVNPAWIHVDSLGLAGWSILEVDPGEPNAANVLRAGARVVASDAYPRTRATLERAGVQVVVVDVSEIAKAEGAVTCCSVLLD